MNICQTRLIFHIGKTIHLKNEFFVNSHTPKQIPWLCGIFHAFFLLFLIKQGVFALRVSP